MRKHTDRQPRERSKDEIPFRDMTAAQKRSYLWDYWICDLDRVFDDTYEKAAIVRDSCRLQSGYRYGAAVTGVCKSA